MTSAAARRDTPSPITVPVPLGDRAYDILVGRGLIETAGSRIAALGARAAAVVTDEHVGPLYADALARSLEAQGLRVSVITLPPGGGARHDAAFPSLSLPSHSPRALTMSATTRSCGASWESTVMSAVA